MKKYLKSLSVKVVQCISRSLQWKNCRKKLVLCERLEKLWTRSVMTMKMKQLRAIQRIRGFSMTMRYINRHYLSIYLSNTKQTGRIMTTTKKQKKIPHKQLIIFNVVLTQQMLIPLKPKLRRGGQKSKTAFISKAHIKMNDQVIFEDKQTGCRIVHLGLVKDVEARRLSN